MSFRQEKELKERRLKLAGGVLGGLVLLMGAWSVRGCHTPVAKKAKVSGKVTLDGVPVPGAIVWFVGDLGPKMHSPPKEMASTNAQGEFSLRAGAMVGKNRVAVKCLKQAPPPQMNPNNPSLNVNDTGDGSEKPKTDDCRLPEKYAMIETSQILVEVEPGENMIPIELKRGG